MTNPLRYTKVPRTILWLIEGGTLTRRSSDGGEEPVEIESFYLGKFPVTNEQFEAFMPEFRRNSFSSGDKDPAIGVSWLQADSYCRWYAKVARKPMRLPTEEEWEWACRGEGSSDIYFDPAEVGDYVWSRENTNADQIPRLDRKKANPAGLWGMLGGVWDWTLGIESSVDESSARRALRGGSYQSAAADLDVYLRRLEPVDASIEDAGFRVAKPMRGN